MPKVPMWRLEWDSNLRPSGHKAPNLPLVSAPLSAVLTIGRWDNRVNVQSIKLEMKLQTTIMFQRKNQSKWWISGGFGALRSERYRFESHSNCHVETLGKSFAYNCSAFLLLHLHHRSV